MSSWRESTGKLSDSLPPLRIGQAVGPSGGQSGSHRDSEYWGSGFGADGYPDGHFSFESRVRCGGYDLVEKQVLDLVPLGLRPTRSPKEAAMGADLVLLSLPNWGAVQSVVEGEEGILRAAQPGLVIMDTSTVEPWETKAMAERLAPMGIEWMDVPVSGSAAQARVGNMVFMAGGKNRHSRGLSRCLIRWEEDHLCGQEWGCGPAEAGGEPDTLPQSGFGD